MIYVAARYRTQLKRTMRITLDVDRVPVSI